MMQSHFRPAAAAAALERNRGHAPVAFTAAELQRVADEARRYDAARSRAGLGLRPRSRSRSPPRPHSRSPPLHLASPARGDRRVDGVAQPGATTTAHGRESGRPAAAADRLRERTRAALAAPGGRAAAGAAQHAVGVPWTSAPAAVAIAALVEEGRERTRDVRSAFVGELVGDAERRDAVAAAVRSVDAESIGADVAAPGPRGLRDDFDHFAAMFSRTASAAAASGTGIAVLAAPGVAAAAAAAGQGGGDDLAQGAPVLPHSGRARRRPVEADPRFQDSSDEDGIDGAEGDGAGIPGPAGGGVGSGAQRRIGGCEASLAADACGRRASEAAGVRAPSLPGRTAPAVADGGGHARPAPPLRDGALPAAPPPLYTLLRVGHRVLVWPSREMADDGDIDASAAAAREARVIGITHGGYAVATYRVRYAAAAVAQWRAPGSLGATAANAEAEDGVPAGRLEAVAGVDYGLPPSPRADAAPSPREGAGGGSAAAEAPAPPRGEDAVVEAVAAAARALVNGSLAAPTPAAAAAASDVAVLRTLAAALADERYDGAASRARPLCLAHVGLAPPPAVVASAGTGGGGHGRAAVTAQTACPRGDMCRAKHPSRAELSALRARAESAAVELRAADERAAAADSARARLAAIRELRGVDLVAPGLLLEAGAEAEAEPAGAAHHHPRDCLGDGRGATVRLAAPADAAAPSAPPPAPPSFVAAVVMAHMLKPGGDAPSHVGGGAGAAAGWRSRIAARRM